jgi:hypothetical protein
MKRFDENGDWKINWKLENEMYVYVHLNFIKGVVIFEKKTSFKKKLYHVFNEENYLL